MFGLFSFHHIWSQFVLSIGMFIGWPWESPLGYLGCPRCTPTEEALPPKGGVRKVIGFQMYKHVQNMNEIQRDSKRFKEKIYLIYLIYDQPLHQGNSVFELSCFSVPINSMPVSLPGLGQRIQDADRQFQGAAALPAPRQTLVNTGEHTQRVYMLTIIKL